MMEAFHVYAFASSAYLAVQSMPLLFTPGLLVTLCASEPRPITDLETYLSRTLGLAVLTLGLLLVLLTGAFPLAALSGASAGTAVEGGGSSSSNKGSDGGVAKSPFKSATLLVTTTYHALTAFYLYMQLASGMRFAFAAGLTFSTALFALGVWVALFGGEKARISKKTGADKRTSNYPFENKESAREKKREKREEEKEKEREKGGKKRSMLRSSSYR